MERERIHHRLLQGFLVVIVLSCNQKTFTLEVDNQTQQTKHQMTKPAHAVVTVLRDAGNTIKHLFDWDSYKIIVGTFPFFAIGSMVDDSVHSCFYKRWCHKNRNQWPPVLHGLAQYGFIFPAFLGFSCMLASNDVDLQYTSQIFLFDIPLVMISSDLIKRTEFNHGFLRPWCERFSSEKRAYGGFPSGHVALMSYAAFSYGLRFGPKWGIPLGAFAAFIGISFINCNRHYTSQVIAGGALGALWGFAVSKAVDDKLARRLQEKNISLAFGMGKGGKPTVKVSYAF